MGEELIGGKRSRGSENKTPFLTALEEDKESKPLEIKLNKVKGSRKIEAEQWYKHHLNSGSMYSQMDYVVFQE